MIHHGISMKHLLLFFLFLTGCQHVKQEESQAIGPSKIKQQELMVQNVDKHSFLVSLPDGQDIQIQSDSLTRSSFIITQTGKLELDFYIRFGYVGAAYWGYISEIGDVLLIESYFHGVSGRAANVINVSIIPFENGSPVAVLSYNSFLGGIDRISAHGEKTVLTILEPTGLEEFYCASSFHFSDGKLIPDGIAGCYKVGTKGLEPMLLDSCAECSALVEPFVMQKN